MLLYGAAFDVVGEPTSPANPISVATLELLMLSMTPAHSMCADDFTPRLQMRKRGIEAPAYDAFPLSQSRQIQRITSGKIEAAWRGLWVPSPTTNLWS